MNAYDFDGTIYRGDSSVDFYVYCLIRFPWILVLLPYQILGVLAYKCRLCSKETEKSIFFSFLKYVPDVTQAVNSFWKKNKKYIASWYLQQQKQDDIIISASPEFLLAPLCSGLGITHLIASKVDIQTGKFIGKNCYGEEKVHRLRQYLHDARISHFYSDSRSDYPLAQIADQAFLVKNATHISNWN